MASAIYSPRYYSKRSLIHSTPCPQTFFLVGIYHFSGEDSTLPFFDSSSTSRNKGIHALPLVKLFAPNAEQMYIVNHLKESPAEEKRTVLEESARRAHGDTQDLADLNSSKLEAVIIPVILGWPRTAPSTVL